MPLVRLKMYDLKLIRLLALFQIATLIIIIICCIGWKFLSIFVYINTGLFLVESIFQLGYIKYSKGEVQFDKNGVEIKKNKFQTFVNWNAVKGVYYNSFGDIFPLLNHCTLELWIEYDGKTIVIDNEIGNIKCTKKKYKQIVSLIPYDILEENEFLLYRSLGEKHKSN